MVAGGDPQPGSLVDLIAGLCGLLLGVLGLGEVFLSACLTAHDRPIFPAECRNLPRRIPKLWLRPCKGRWRRFGPEPKSALRRVCRANQHHPELPQPLHDRTTALPG